MIRRHDKVLRTGIIYKWTSPVRKCYIGQTLDPKGRYYDFVSKKKKYAGTKINRARKKYGSKNFSYEILYQETSDNIEQLQKNLDEKEKYYIKLFDSIENGYNMAEGGQNNALVGYTEESKIKHKTSIKKYYETHESVVSKKVAQYSKKGDLIKVWESSNKAALAINVERHCVANACRGKSKTCGGYMWRYIENDTVLVKIEPLKTKWSVYQYSLDGELIEIWETTKEAAKYFKCGCEHIGDICNGLHDHKLNGYLLYNYKTNS